MREIALVAWPLLAAGIAMVWRGERTRPYLLPVTGAVHLVLAVWVTLAPSPTGPVAWIESDALSRAVLPMLSLVFFLSACYGVAYLKVRAEQKNQMFVAPFLALLGLLSLAIQSQHLGLLWVAAEATTLTTIPLLHFNGTARAFEATWKYLLICGTGIALSLLGSFCLGYAEFQGSGVGDLTFRALSQHGPALSRPWVIAAWVLLLTGYGTKMGLAPMHTWKPDAYGEAPGVVGAILAGGVTTMAFVAVLRVKQVMDAAGAGMMVDRTLLAIGLFSMLVAALFVLATTDVKRMLAYSSIEHMGVLSVGAALGGAGLAAALFHVWTNGLTKGSMFLSAGNLRRAAGASTVREVAGMAWRTPASSRLLVAGLLAITAVPPFGPFFSEIAIVRAAFEGGRWGVAALFLVALLLAFAGISRLVFAIVDGRPRIVSRSAAVRFRESPSVIVPPLAFLIASLWLGLATPNLLRDAWSAAAASLQGMP